jgi:hypothetical protein
MVRQPMVAMIAAAAYTVVQLNAQDQAAAIDLINATTAGGYCWHPFPCSRTVQSSTNSNREPDGPLTPFHAERGQSVQVTCGHVFCRTS